MATGPQKIVPHLWFDRQAEEAAQLYTSTFKDSRTGSVTRYTSAGFETHHMPEGMAMTVDFEVDGYRFIALNGGPLFKFNPSISFMVPFETAEEVDAAWTRLSEGGKSLMELGEYPFSKRYGWTEDRYGVSWQLMLAAGIPPGHNLTPTLMFTGDKCGKAEEAVNLYTSMFDSSKVEHIQRYEKGIEPDREGTIQHAGFILESQSFAAMDSALEHNFTFNEAVSLMVQCETQEEIDRYWKLSAVPEAEQCGWLKDRFGVSWQVTPTILGKMLSDPDRAKVERVTNAFLKMKKFDIAELKKAYEG